MSTSNLLDVAAELGSEEDDEDFNEVGEERGQRQKRDGNNFDDSSEEEDDDDDEAAAEEVRKGFIVDEDDEEDDEAEAKAERRRERKKRRREEREEEEGLDDEDLDLIGELDTEKPQQSKFKRLKQGHRERERGVDEIFDDDDDDDRIPGRGALEDELDDFIEEDELDDDERRRELEEIEVSRKPHKGLAGLGNLEAQGLDPAAWEDITAAFGVGEDYDWALDKQLQADQTGENMDGEGPKLADVFEPSQLAEKMLTDEDMIVKQTDIPERYQVWRKDLPDLLTDAEDRPAALKAEAEWIAIYLWPKKAQAQHFDAELKEPFTAAIAKVLEYACVQNFEVPFIFSHRKDYVIHREKISGHDGGSHTTSGVKLLSQSDLWSIIEYDLKYRTLLEKRKAIQSQYEKVKELAGISDNAIEDRLPVCETNEEVQDVQDYFNFRYSAELADLKSMGNGEQNGLKRARGTNIIYEAVRAGPCYNVVRGFGVSADNFAKTALDDSVPAIVDDPPEKPEDLAAKNTDERLKTGESVLKMAKVMFTEELVLNPRLRTHLRGIYFGKGYFDCIRTEKGLRKIDEDHAYYDLKYLRRQSLRTFLDQPQLFLKMLKAQSEGYIELKMKLDDENKIRNKLLRKLESDAFSEVADAWNALRKEVLNNALDKLHTVITRSVVETLRSDCEGRLAELCREEFSHRLDQAPYRPQHSDMSPGQAPRVLTLTNGRGSPNKEDVFWCYVEEDGRVLEQGRLKDLRLGVAEKGLPDGEGVRTFVEIANRRTPDVIGVSGFSVETRMLYNDLKEVVKQYDLRGHQYDTDNDQKATDPLEVVLVNDEVARLYYQSDRAAAEYPTFPPLIRYSVALAKYLQNPLVEYASLGKDINAVSFHQDQALVAPDKLTRYLETALVDMVNLVGVEVHEALRNKRVANLLKYVCGFGPRKAQGFVDTINRWWNGEITSRDELIGNEEETGKPPALTVAVWQNCASFIFFDFDPTDPSANYLDNTRIHPEDYDLARKIASDALELDEEDIRGEEEEYGKFAIVRKLVRDDASERVNDLELEEYATQLQDNFHTRKRATLETIRNELMSAYEELRHDFMVRLRAEQMFTMLTGETQETLHANMLVPVAIRKIFPDHIEGRLDCGIEVGINAENYPAGVGPDGMSPRDAYHPGQVIQGKLMFINHGQLSAQVSLKENDIKMRFREAHEREPDEWDFNQEDDDRRELRKRAETSTGRSQRVIKHPLFRAANSKEAENILAGQSRGDCVIRPGSKGSDHLAITWKVSDGVFQHIDVLELDKENEFSVGRVLKIGGKYTYSDLDELIELHVKAMARKVDEIMNDERYQKGTKEQTEEWLAAYTEANPTRSMYAFCINKQYPGYFYLCFKAGREAKPAAWPIKVIPNAFELMKNPYPDMKSLKNGFKTVYATMASRKGQGHAGVPGPGAGIGAPLNARPMPVRRY